MKRSTTLSIGSEIDTYGGTDAHVKARIGKARTAFVILKVWNTREIHTSTRLRMITPGLANHGRPLAPGD